MAMNISRVKPEDTGAIDGGAIIIISDVTAQRNAAKMRQDFFESASHELKTPITSIKGFAELLCSDMPLGGNKQEAISKRILKETMRMSSLISDIIMISRLESGDITFEREVLDLAAVVSECTGAAIETLYSMQTVSRADFDAGETYLTLLERNYEALRKGLNA